MHFFNLFAKTSRWFPYPVSARTKEAIRKQDNTMATGVRNVLAGTNKLNGVFDNRTILAFAKFEYQRRFKIVPAAIQIVLDAARCTSRCGRWFAAAIDSS